MADPPVFIELTDTEAEGLAPQPIPEEPIPIGIPRPHILPYGTTVAQQWSRDWTKKVIEVEDGYQYAICGAKRRAQELREGEAIEDPLVLVCRHRAGWNTDHPGEGRCRNHDANDGLIASNLQAGQFSLLRHRRIGSRVQEFFEDEKLLDMRSAIGTIWAAMDAVLDEDETITAERAQEVGTLMTRVGNLIKQYNDIQEKRRISIEVPEFMAWAEFFYELAVKYIDAAGGDVAGFLRDAQQFYNRTVTIVVGPEGSRNRLGAGDEISPVEDAGVSRPQLQDA